MPPPVATGSPTTRRPRLVRYQRRFIRDPARFKLFVKARRIGGSFAVSLADAYRAAGFAFDERGRLRYRPETGVNQFLISASHEQSINLLGELARHLDVLSATAGKKLVASESKTRIELTNGVECLALAPNPRTIRGGGGDVTLDEFGVVPFPKKIWAAAAPMVNPTLRHRQGFRLTVVGSPLGDDNKFYELACTDAGRKFSIHTVNIYDALRDGFPVDIEECREIAGDADTFAQEYECAFLSALARYIPADVYDAACYDEDERPEAEGGIGYAGYDVARKATGDLLAIVELQRIAGVLWHDRTYGDRGVSWDDQEKLLGDTLARCTRIAIDATAMGSQFAERAQKKYGTSRVEAVEFTGKSKELLATGLRLALERKTLRPRRDDPEMKRDVLSLRREVTTAGNVKYGAPRTKRGHADRAWALALANHTAGPPLPKELGTTSGAGSEAEDVGSLF